MLTTPEETEMPRYIVKVGDRYGEWSTVPDAPTSYLMSRDDFEEFYMQEYGRWEIENGSFAKRMERVDAKGTSSQIHNSAESVMTLNRYGPGESCLPVATVIEKWNSESDKTPTPEETP